MRKWILALPLLLWGSGLLAKEDLELREILDDQKYAEGWIYEDIDAGYAQAKKTGKPLLVCFCCVP